MLDVLMLDKPEQLKALGHPLRLRILETLGTKEGDEALTNRDLAGLLGVDPGHLHFHVQMLLRAGLITLAESSGRGREKPYRAVARTLRVAPELLASGLTSDLREAMLAEVQRGFANAGEGTFRSAQVTARISPERALELVTELVERARDEEDEGAEPLVITAVFHPPTSSGQSRGEAKS
jgi:DNA-binding transcriptional ArsR family regulator